MNDLDLIRDHDDDSLPALLVSFCLLVLLTCTATLFLYFALRGEARPITVAQYASALAAKAKAAEARKAEEARRLATLESERLARRPDPVPTTLAAAEAPTCGLPWVLPARPDCDRPRWLPTARARRREEGGDHDERWDARSEALAGVVVLVGLGLLLALGVVLLWTWKAPVPGGVLAVFSGGLILELLVAAFKGR